MATNPPPRETISPSPGASVSNQSAAAPRVAQKPTVVFTVDWDYSSHDHLIASPIAIYHDRRYTEPPCENDQAAAEFRRDYLAPGTKLYVFGGSERIGEVTVTGIAFPKEVSCYALIAQVDMPDEVAEALEERGDVLLAVGTEPPEQPEPRAQRAGDAFGPAEDAAADFLVANGVREEVAVKMETEVWILPGSRGDLFVSAHGFIDELGPDEDSYSLLMLRRRRGEGSEPVLVEYSRTPPARWAEYCFVQFIDAVDLSRKAGEADIFIKYRCAAGVGHGVYAPEGARLYTGAFYQLDVVLDTKEQR